MKPANVLIVDDNPVDLMLQERILKRCAKFGEIFKVNNGQEALDFYNSYHEKEAANDPSLPALVFLLDINMPVLNGFEFVEELSGQKNKTPYRIVMLTSSSASLDKEKAEKSDNIDQFLVKPLSLKDAHALADSYAHS